MTTLRRFRGPLVGLVAVLFSASIVLAAQPASPGASGLAKASQHAGQGVGAADESSEPAESAEPAESNDAADSTDANSSDTNHCNIDLNDPTAVAAAPNHGAIVCSAANMATPTGYANHGAWVSHWARMNHGADASTTGKSHKPSTTPPSH